MHVHVLHIRHALTHCTDDVDTNRIVGKDVVAQTEEQDLVRNGRHGGLSCSDEKGQARGLPFLVKSSG
jgi:hypothetical protein